MRCLVPSTLSQSPGHIPGLRMPAEAKDNIKECFSSPCPTIAVQVKTTDMQEREVQQATASVSWETWSL